jgi:hypothetical protein
MKKLAILLFALITGLAVNAQTTCNLTNEKFSEKDLTQVAERLNVDPDYACLLAQKGVYISDRSGKDLSNLPDASQADVLRPLFKGVEPITEANFNEESFNILLYRFDLKEKEMQDFRVGNSGKVITVLSRMRMDAVYRNSNK